MTAGLRTYFHQFRDDSPFTKLDILFIAGDLFDKALYLSGEDTHTIFRFLKDLMSWCAKHKVRLRVLEGTPSHDRAQFRAFLPMAESFTTLDFRYIETMCVEAFYDLQVTCLYVPDEFGGSAEASQKLIDKEFQSLGIRQVSFAIMHGMFRYQVPELASDRFKYEEQFFFDRVKGFINIGHVHVFTTFGRILCQGSTDRICHGEEAAKGGIMVTWDPSGDRNFFFIENKSAMVFTTLHVRIKELEEALARVEKRIVGLPDGSHVRIKAAKGHPVLNVLEHLERKYPGLIFDRITEEEERERNQLIDTQAVLDTNYVPVNIHAGNIVDMIMAEAKPSLDVSAPTMIRIVSTLQGLV